MIKLIKLYSKARGSNTRTIPSSQRLHLKPGQIVLVTNRTIDFAELLRGHGSNRGSGKVPHVSSHNQVDPMPKSSPGDHRIFKITKRISQSAPKVNLRYIKNTYDISQVFEC